MRVILALATVWLLAVLAMAAGAETYPVSDLKALQKLCAETANPGDVIELQPGTYCLETTHIPVLRSGEPGKPITIRGVVKDGVRPIIDASKVNVKRGVFRTEEPTHDVAFEDLDICNAWGERFPSNERFGHGSGAIYFQGKNLTARRVHSHHNEDGWFATHAADNILIENCEIDHNGTLFTGPHNRSHNFYFCAHHQTVRNCYIHDSGEGENFKSRGWNTTFAYNWVEEDAAYSVAVDSGNEGNALWIGNVIIKRKAPGGQRRLLGVGDGTGVAKGTLTMINNTFVTTQPNDFYLFTEASSTCDVVLINNAFVGPGTVFLEKNGKGKITGTHNWFPKGMEVPDTVTDSIFGDDPGLVDLKGGNYRPRSDSPLVNAGLPAPEFLNENGQLQKVLPECTPSKRRFDRSIPRRISDTVDIGAFELRPRRSE